MEPPYVEQDTRGLEPLISTMGGIALRSDSKGLFIVTFQRLLEWHFVPSVVLFL